MGRFTYRLPGASDNEERLVSSQKVFLILTVIALILIGISGNLWTLFAALFTASLGLLCQFWGRKLYESDTSQNWFNISVGSTFKNIAGWILIILAWAILLSGVLIPAVSLFVRRIQ